MPKLGEVYVAYKALGLDDMNRDISLTEKSVRSSAGAMAASIAGMGVAVAAVITKFGTEFDKVESQIQAQIGNVEKNMLVVKNLFRTGLVDGIEEAGTQATAAIRAFGNETTTEIESSLQFGSAISKQFNLDAPELFSATKTLIDNFKISSQEALDLVAAGFEKGLDRSGDFLESINEYSTQFSSAKATASEFFSGMEKGLQGGALGTDKWADSFKEFRLKILDGKDATAEALAQIGLSQSQIIKDIDSGGTRIVDVYADVTRRLAETEKESVKLGVGAALIGTQFEDLGNVAEHALAMASNSFDDVSGAAARTLESTQTAQRLFDQLVNEGILIAVEAWDKYEGRVKLALAGTLDFVKANRDWPLEMIDNMAGVWDILNVGFVSLMDVGGTTFIEIQHAGEIAWSAIQDVAGKAVSGMLSGLSKMAEGAAEAYGVLGAPEFEGQMTRAAMSIRMVARDVDKWSVNLDKATDSRQAALDAHNKIIDAMVDERAQYKAIGKDAKASGDAVKKIFIEREKKNREITTTIVKNESEKVKAVAILTAKQQKEIDKANKKRIREAEKANRQIIKDREDMSREMEKLESGQFKEFEKQLVESQRIYEDFIRDQLGIKELSTESMAEIDREYQSIKEGVLSGEIESFDSAMTDMLTAKTLSMEKLMENDTAYSVFLAEQEAENKRVRMDFFETTGGFSTEYFANLAGEIEAQAGVWQKAGVDAVAVEEWKLDQFRALDMQRLESSDSFFDGVRLGMLESQNDMTTWVDSGKAIFGDFQKTLAGSFNQLFTGIIRGDMDSLSGAWDSLWRGMLDTVVSNLSQMAAEWASQQIAGLAMSGAEALSSAIFAKDGAFDVGRTGPGQPDPALGGAIPALLHAGESVLPAGLTDQLSGASFDDFKAGVRNYFGLDSGQADSIWSRASEYQGTGANLYKAWQAFDEGNEIQGVIEAMDAMSEAFKTYAQQNGSQVAASIGQGLGEASGVISSGYGAYSAFEAEDYLGAVTQSLNAVQSAVSLYGTATGTTAGTTGAVLGSTATGAISGAGQGLAAWNMLSAFAEIEAGGKAPAQIGAAVGGAVLGSAVGGPVGSVVGGIIGGIAGTGFSIAGEGEFDLSDADPHLAEARKIVDGKITMIPEPGPGGWFSVALGQYFDHLNTQAAAVNQLTDSIAGDMTAADAAKFKAQMTTALSGAVGTIESGGNYNRNRADQMIVGVGNYYWDQTLDAMRDVVGTASGISEQRKNELLGIMAGTDPNYWINPIDMPSNIARMTEERAAVDPWFRAQLKAEEERRLAHISGGGAATGGVVVPRGEDGMLGVQKGEGVIPLDAMKWAEDVGNAILKGQPFGGSFADHDQPIDIGSFAGALPGEVSTRGAVMSELLLNDTVTRLGEGNRLTEETNRLLMRVADVLNQILNAPRIDANGLVNFFLPTLENRVQNGDAQLNSPSVSRMAFNVNNEISRLRQSGVVFGM